MAILFIPILLGMKQLYPWVTVAGDMADDPNYRFKLAYLNPQFFIVRVVIYFAILLMLSYFLNKWSREQDRTGDPSLAKKLEGISGPGLILWGIVVTYSMIDWVMSLEPKWFSTIYGMIFMIVGALTAMSLIILMLRRLADEAPFKGAVTPGQYNDLGNLMLAFTMLWAYLSFSQFLIIWSGNLPQEITWYLHRMQTSWKFVGAVLIGFHFAVPFLLLLSRAVKRHGETLLKVAATLLFLRAVDLWWLIAPELHQDGIVVSWLDVLLPLSLGSLWLGGFVWQLRKRAILPIHDPQFDEALGAIIEHAGGQPGAAR
jgi:hypothetical protein